jgi:hypothetical protein
MEPGARIPARLYKETLEPSAPAARVVAEFPGGAPAAVLSSFGKGHSLTLGSYLAVAYESQRDPAAERFFSSLLDWAGVERPVAVRGGPVEVRWLEAGTTRVVFVFNHGEAAVSPAITLRRTASSATDLLTGQPLPLTRGDGAVQFTPALARGGVSVVELR